MSDAASFHQAEIEAIYGENIPCPFCRNPATDAHHIVKRGFDKGIRPDNPDRKLLSSPLNFLGLCRKCHNSGMLHRVSRQKSNLSTAAYYVARAIRNGHYKITERDIGFLTLFLKDLPDDYPLPFLQKISLCSKSSIASASSEQSTQS